MKKLSYKTYGDAEVLYFKELDIPRLKSKNKILVKVLYSSLNAVDWKYRKGYFGFFTRLFHTNLGFDVVGEVVDSTTNSCRKGELIMGLFPNLQGGAHSEYVVLNRGQFITISPQVNLVELAGLPMVGLTAWLALTKKAKIKKGDKVLINGGSSGVGHIAIQLAKYYGAEVTSVSSRRNQEFCKRLGADYTVSYQDANVLELKKQFDIVFDIVANLSITKADKILASKGCYINTNISLRLVMDMIRYRNVKFVYVYPGMDGFIELYNLIKSKKIKIHIDRTFLFSDIITAHQYVEQSRTTGKVVVNICDMKI